MSAIAMNAGLAACRSGQVGIQVAGGDNTRTRAGERHGTSNGSPQRMVCGLAGG